MSVDNQSLTMCNNLKTYQTVPNLCPQEALNFQIGDII